MNPGKLNTEKHREKKSNFPRCFSVFSVFNFSLYATRPLPLKILLFFLLFASCSKKHPPVVEPSFPVRIGQSIERDTPLTLEALGHVESIKHIQVRSRIEGELMKVHFQEGMEVKQGDLLFTIDPRPYQAALQAAQATLEQSLANLALSEDKVRRYGPLTQEEYFSLIDFETIQTNFRVNSALVQQNQANVDAAAINLDYCWIYAPVDGLTGILQIDQGNLVSADGTPLITLNQMAPIYVTFSIPELSLPKVREAQKKGILRVLTAFEDFKKQSFEGVLQMIDNSVDSATGMIKLRAIFPNEQRDLWPSQFVRTRLILNILSHAVVIPFTAIQQTQSGPIVYVVKPDHTVEVRPVKLGQREDEEVIILQGLNANESIVVEGQLNLFQGAKVYESI